MRERERRKEEIFTYPSIHRLGCVATQQCGALRARAGYRILFSWGGISSVFKSDRVLAINDDAVFLGGRAALII